MNKRQLAQEHKRSYKAKARMRRRTSSDIMVIDVPASSDWSNTFMTEATKPVDIVGRMDEATGGFFSVINTGPRQHEPVTVSDPNNFRNKSVTDYL